MTFRLFPAAAVALLAAGCHTSAPVHHEQLTFGAGDAIAANTVMQMVDPWPRSSDNTHLVVPADRDQYSQREAAAVSGPAESATEGGTTGGDIGS